VDTHRVNGMCAHIGGGPQLKDVIVRVASEALWRKLGKIIKRLGRLVKLKLSTCPKVGT